MQKFERSVFLYKRMLLILNCMLPHIVRGESQSLFASLGQLELLWKNELDVVKTMESLLKEKIPEYRPIKRYFFAIFTIIKYKLYTNSRHYKNVAMNIRVLGT